MLVDGNWTGAWQPFQGQDAAGRFVRQPSSIRSWITEDGLPGPTGEGGFKAETDRYLLYVTLICPWANRTLIARNLKALRDHIDVVVLSPVMSDQGWAFDGFEGCTEDPLFGSSHLHQLYTRHDKGFSGRATVPVLWDRQKNCIVSNESADILRMFNQAFGRITAATPDLCPTKLEKTIDLWNDQIYNGLNNAVYQAGFAVTQQAYNEAVVKVFGCLSRLEEQLSSQQPYLLGEQITETDIRLFVSLVRFDAAYHGLFKCNLRRLRDYPHLSAYLNRLMTLPAFAGTVDLRHIKTGYYSIRALNPSGIIPAGPEISWEE